MMRPDANVAVFVCVTPVDMRKQAATLRYTEDGRVAI
jgi:hypothetical protein